MMTIITTRTNTLLYLVQTWMLAQEKLNYYVLTKKKDIWMSRGFFKIWFWFKLSLPANTGNIYNKYLNNAEKSELLF